MSFHKVALADFGVALCVHIDFVGADLIRGGRVVVDTECLFVGYYRPIIICFVHDNSQTVFVVREFFNTGRRDFAHHVVVVFLNAIITTELELTGPGCYFDRAVAREVFLGAEALHNNLQVVDGRFLQVAQADVDVFIVRGVPVNEGFPPSSMVTYSVVTYCGLFMTAPPFIASSLLPLKLLNLAVLTILSPLTRISL